MAENPKAPGYMRLRLRIASNQLGGLPIGADTVLEDMDTGRMLKVINLRLDIGSSQSMREFVKIQADVLVDEVDIEAYGDIQVYALGDLRARQLERMLK